MIVKNEERCLARCLASVRAVADEIIIVDTGSNDNTIKIASNYNATTVHYKWTDDFAAARNYGLERTTGDWILVLDADEFASKNLTHETLLFINHTPSIGRLRIVSDFRKNGAMFRSQSYVARLFPRGARFQGRIHEQIVSPLPRVNLRAELWHDGYLNTQKSDRNVKLLLAELEAGPDSPYLLYQLAVEYTTLERPDEALKCLQRAFTGMKFTDPFAPNIVVDLLYTTMALQCFEVGREAIGKSLKYLDDFPDFHLALGLFYMNLIRSNPAKFVTELQKIEESFQRCLALGETDKYKSVLGSGSFLASYNLGVFYSVLGNSAGARKYLEQAAAHGYGPAAEMLDRLKPVVAGGSR